MRSEVKRPTYRCILQLVQGLGIQRKFVKTFRKKTNKHVPRRYYKSDWCPSQNPCNFTSPGRAVHTVLLRS